MSVLQHLAAALPPPLQAQGPPCSQSTATPMHECFLILRQGFAKFTRLVLNSLLWPRDAFNFCSIFLSLLTGWYYRPGTCVPEDLQVGLGKVLVFLPVSVRSRMNTSGGTELGCSFKPSLHDREQAQQALVLSQT